MKKKIAIAIALFLTVVNYIVAENKVSIADTSISAGETKEIDVLLDNDVQYVAFQYDLYLPTGITLVGYEVNENRVPKSTTVSMAEQEDGSYRFLAAAMSMEPISGSSGSIVTLKLKTDASIAFGNKTGYLRNVKLSKEDGTGVTISEVPFAVKVLDPSVISGSCKKYFGDEAIWMFNEATKTFTIRPNNGDEITQPLWDVFSNLKVTASEGAVNKLGSDQNWKYTKGVQKAFEEINGSYATTNQVDKQQDYSYVDFMPTSGNITVGFNIPGTLSEKYDIYLVTCPIWLKSDYMNIPQEEWDSRPYRFTASVIERENEGDNIGQFPNKGVQLENPNPIDGISNTIFISRGLAFNADGSTLVNDTTYLGEYEFKSSYDGGDYGVIIQIASSILSSQRKNFSGEMLISSIILKPHNNDTPLDINISEKVEHVVVENGITNINCAFDAYGFHHLKTVDISNSVISICNGAFQNCSDLASMVIPNNVTSISKSVFAYCNSLKSVTIPNSVTSIGESAFDMCSNLSSVTIGSGVTSIGKSAFNGCGALTSVIIPNSVISIGESSFQGCSNLSSVTMGNGVTSIEKSAFNGCSALTSVIIPNSVTSIGESSFKECSNLSSVTMGNGVTSIGQYAFYGCMGLTSVIIPDSVKFIGVGAFGGCKDLASVTINSNAIVSASYQPSVITGTTRGLYNVFGDVKEYILGEDVKSIGAMAFYRSTSLTSMIIPNGVTSIGYGAISGCVNLPTLTIPESVTTIGDRCFYNCHSLTSIVIPESVTTISDEMFYHCENLISANIPEKVTRIGLSAFNGCQSLSSLTIPTSVKTIDEWAFADCKSLTSIFIPSSVTKISLRAFWGCSGLTSIVVDEGNTRFDSRDGCNAIIRTSSNNLIAGCQNTIIPNSVTSIDNNAFGFCKMTSVTIPESVTSIGNYAFSSCANLTDFYCYAKNVPEAQYPFAIWATDDPAVNLEEITLHVPAASIEAYKEATPWSNFGYIVALPDESIIVDSNCIDGIYYNFDAETRTAEVIKGEKEYVGDIVIPKSVKYGGATYTVISIGDAAFSGCGDVTSVVIPESVTSIGWTAFEETSLTSVFIPESVTSIGSYAFSGTNITSVIIPKSVTSIGQGVFSYCHNLTSVLVEDDNPIYDSREDCNAIIETASNTLIEGWEFSSIPNSVTSLGNGAFVYCNDMTTINIPGSVTSIESETFWGCGLTSVTIPESVTSIGTHAFYCTELTDMYCYAKTLPKTEGEIFYDVDLKNVTLHVPAESIDLYNAAEPWKNFGKIVAMEVSGLAGDANGDGTVNVFDVTAMVNDILGSPNEGFVFAAADVNGDGIVNVFDVTKVVNIILGVDDSEAKKRKAEGQSGADKLYFEDFEIEPGEEKEVNILLNNPDAEYRDLQFDLYLPEGITVVQDEDEEFLVDTGSRCTKKHTIGFSYTDGHYVCMLYSTAKNPLTGNSGDILTITLKADDNVAPGVKTGFFRNVSLSKTDATGPTYDEFSFGFTVKGEVDAIEDVDAEAAPANKKILRNGEVIIIQDGKEYDVNGKPAQ